MEDNEQSEQGEQQEAPVRQTSNPLKYFKPIAILVLAIIVVIVVRQNTEEVETRFLLATVTMPRAVLLGTTTASGFLLGVLVSMKVHSRRRSRE